MFLSTQASSIYMDEFENIDEVMLPGFRFHPTDEELVGFYLTRKIQQQSLSIELIKQLNIYKYDPWDLSKFAMSGEKEWYFYCPRDRKYRNSVRPNRVTGAGFWKATGTDKPIYSSESISKCIGLKKSLVVFYRGKASKGIKTDYMMHEFRLRTASDSQSNKRVFDKNIPANEAWSICRIFKKAKSKQALSQYSWVCPVIDTTTPSNIISLQATNSVYFNSSKFSTENTVTSFPQFSFHNDIPEQSSIAMSTPPRLYHVENEPISNRNQLIAKCDTSSVLVDMPMPPSILASEGIAFCTMHEQCDGFSTILPDNMQGNFSLDVQNVEQSDDQFGALMCMGYGDSFPLSSPSDAWNSSLLWDSSPCISDLSNSFSTN